MIRIIDKLFIFKGTEDDKDDDGRNVGGSKQ